MIDHQLELGTKIYCVEENNNAFIRKKITSKDEDGVEWYRYDKPLRTHNMKEYTIIGRVLKVIEGQVRNTEEQTDVYYLDNDTDIGAGDINETCAWKCCFLDKDLALAWIARRKEEGDQLERS